MAERLAGALSPYLQQHADQPVDWWPWGAGAFAEAARLDVPVLLSVGYAACHWCHVMAHESFDDPALAAYLDGRFVAVKVDREERPDVDAAYMGAVVALTGRGGWPMTVFLTPDGRPFHAGTYFPPAPGHGLPSLRQVLEAVHGVWRHERPRAEALAADLAAGLHAHAVHVPGAGDPGPAGDPDRRAALLDAAVQDLADAEDPLHGGFGGAPKFPPSTVLEFLVRRGRRCPVAHGLAGRTLAAMAAGGLHDQLEGGFARYAVDRAWVVPHFEKMLYDNALLARVYLHWWRLTGDPLGLRVAVDTCSWMVRDLLTAEGGLASSLDADTDGVEGAHAVWTPAQLHDVLGPDDGAWAAQLLGVTPRGTFEHGTSTLHLTRDVWAGPEADRWRCVRALLVAHRRTRPRPGRDDKVVTAWNGLALAALAETGLAADRPDLVAAAECVARLMADVHVDPAAGPVPGAVRVRRVSRGGVVSGAAGALDDHACLAEGLLALHAVTGDRRWADLADGLALAVLTCFADADGVLRDTAPDTPDPVPAALGRGASHADRPCPSGPSAAAQVLLACAGSDTAAPVDLARAGAVALMALGPAAVASQGGAAPGWAQAHGRALAVLETLDQGATEATVHDADDELTRTVLLGTLALARVRHRDAPAPGAPGTPGVVLCRDRTCSAPLGAGAALREALDVRVPGPAGAGAGPA